MAENNVVKKVIHSRIQNKYAVPNDWEIAGANQFKPLPGEFIIHDTTKNDDGTFKAASEPIIYVGDGVSTVADLIPVGATETAERIAADTAEESARKAADEQLQANIDLEATTREAKDEELSGKIDAEIKNRTDADTQIRNDLTTETAEREAADAELESKLTITITPADDADDDNNDKVIKKYEIKQGSNAVGTIDIPVDLVVKSGSVQVATQDGIPYAEAKINDYYIDLEIANGSETKHIYIPANSLVDVTSFVHGAPGSMIDVVTSGKSVHLHVYYMERGEADNSIVVFDGKATAEYAVAAGTNDKSAIIPIVGETLASAIKVDNPIASGVAAIAVGAGSEATTAGAIAIGSLNRVGVTGFYWKDIDFTTNTITLVKDKSPNIGSIISGLADVATLQANVDAASVASCDWVEGDTISIVNNAKYPFCAKIKSVGTASISYKGYVKGGFVPDEKTVTSTTVAITLDSLPFTEVVSPTLTLPDDYTIFACYKKDIATQGIAGAATHERWYPRSGSVTIGWAGTAFGVENLVSGSAAFAGGWNNYAAGDFGAVFGRDNISSYAGLTVGSGNISNSDSAIVTGHGNEVTGSTNALVFGGSNVVSAGQAMVGGYNNSVTDGSAGAIVGGDTNKVTSAYCTFVCGRNNTVSGAQGIISGQYVKNTGGRNLVVGDRVADTVADGATQTYTITEVTGNNNVVGGHGNFVSSNHSAAFGTRHKLTGNKGQIAAGSNNELTNWNNAAFGRHLQATTSAMAAVGQFNKPTDLRAMFVVGNGNATSSGSGNTSGKADEICDNGTTYSIVRDNAFVVYYKGSATVGSKHSIADATGILIAGTGNTANAENTILAGRSNIANGNDSAIFGEANTSNAANTFAAGYSNIIAADCGESTIFGNNNAIGSDIAIEKPNGETAAIAVKSSLAAGRNNIVYGSYSAVFGQSNITWSGNGGVFGYFNTVDLNSASSFVAGDGNIVKGYTQTVLGRYNQVASQDLLVIGNGSGLSATQYNELSDSEKAKYTAETGALGEVRYTKRSNAFRVTSGGQVIAAGKMTAGADPSTDNDVVTLRYFRNNASKVDWDNITDYVHIKNNADVDGNLGVGGDLSVAGKLTITDLQIDGDLTFGDLITSTFSTSATNNITAVNAAVIGKNSVAVGQNSLIVGDTNTNDRNNSLLVGHKNKNLTASNADSGGSGAAAIGEGLYIGQAFQLVVGTYNERRTDARLVVGNGSESSRKNAFVVYSNGRVEGGRSTTASDSGLTLATKDYVDSHSGGGVSGSGLPEITDDMQVGAILVIALDEHGNKVWKVQNPPSEIYFGEVE